MVRSNNKDLIMLSSSDPFEAGLGKVDVETLAPKREDYVNSILPVINKEAIHRFGLDLGLPSKIGEFNDSSKTLIWSSSINEFLGCYYEASFIFTLVPILAKRDEYFRVEIKYDVYIKSKFEKLVLGKNNEISLFMCFYFDLDKKCFKINYGNTKV